MSPARHQGCGPGPLPLLPGLCGGEKPALVTCVSGLSRKRQNKKLSR